MDMAEFFKFIKRPKFPDSKDYKDADEYKKALEQWELETKGIDDQMNTFNKYAELAMSDVPEPVQARHQTAGQYSKIDPQTMTFNPVDPMAMERKKKEMEEMIRMGGLMGISPNASLQQRWSSLYG